MKKVCFVLLIFLISCKDSLKNEKTFDEINIKVKKIEKLSIKTFETALVGLDLEKLQLFVKQIPETKDYHKIAIVNINQGKIEKEVKLRVGSEQSPSGAFRTEYIQRVGDKYFVVDPFAKIMTFDKNFTWIHSSMFHEGRKFIDFFKIKERYYYMFGNFKISYKKIKYDIEIYEIFPHLTAKKAKKIKSIGTGYFELPFRGRVWHEGAIWANIFGFEKNGKLYFCDNQESKIYIYDFNEHTKETIKLSYLKEKEFSVEDNMKFFTYKSTNYVTKRQHKMKFTRYPRALYHFGLYDVGKNLIGIAGEIRLNLYTFRLDIFNVSGFKYLYSIWLPIDWGIKMNLRASSKGILPSLINIDNGFFAYTGLDIDSNMEAVLFKFKII